MTRLLLLFPPFTDASQPAAAIPALVAAVEGCGIDVHAWDTNLDAWEYLLDPARQRRWLARIGAALSRLDRRPALDLRAQRAYTALADGWLRGHAANDELTRAVEVLRSPAFYEAPAYRRAMGAIDAALAVVSAVFHPSRVEWGRFWPSRSNASSRAIAAMACSRRENPFLAFAVEQFAPRVDRLAPSIIGITITYLDQVVPAFTLARECKRILPGVTVVMGGQIPSLWGDALMDAAPLWRHVDLFVRGDGEDALRAIVRAQQRRELPTDHPGIAVRGQPYRESIPEPIDALPCPDYRQLPLGRYLAPEPVLTLGASRGCYWGRCAFCAVSPAFRGTFRARSPERVRADLRLLADRHRARHFFFADDALPRSVVRSLAREEPDAARSMRWQAEIRWDAVRTDDVAGLARSGARNLVFGFESGSPRVLRRMVKGASLDHAANVIARCAEASIGVNLQCFLGFPGETLKDVRATLGFLDRARGAATTVSCGLFELQKCSPVWRDPAAFGIRILPAAQADDLATRFEFEPQPGRRHRREVIGRIRRRFEPPAPQLRCGIHAHALLYLSEAPAAMAEPAPARVAWNERLERASGSAHRLLAWDPFSFDGKPRRRPLLLAFSLAGTTCVSVGPLGTAILNACDRGARPSDLVVGLSRSARARVTRMLVSLTRRGLIASTGGRPGDDDLRREDRPSDRGRDNHRHGARIAAVGSTRRRTTAGRQDHACGRCLG